MSQGLFTSADITNPRSPVPCLHVNNVTKRMTIAELHHLRAELEELEAYIAHSTNHWDKPSTLTDCPANSFHVVI